MSNYPAQIDNSLSLPAAVDNASTVSASIVNKLRAAILAAQTELGIKPSGTFGTVRERLDSLEGSINSLDTISLAGDLGGSTSSPMVIGLQGRPLSSALPSTGQAIEWNGIAWAPADVISLAGDLGGTFATPLVIGLYGRPLSSALPTSGQVLGWDGADWLPVDAVTGAHFLTLSLTGTSTNGSVVDLLDGGSNPFTLDDSKSYAIKVTALAERTDDSGRAMWVNDILMHCDGGIAVMDEKNITLELLNGETWDMDFNVTGLDNFLNATFTGTSGHTVDVSVLVQWLELTGFAGVPDVYLLTELGEVLKAENDEFIVVEA